MKCEKLWEWAPCLYVWKRRQHTARKGPPWKDLMKWIFHCTPHEKEILCSFLHCKVYFCWYRTEVFVSCSFEFQLLTGIWCLNTCLMLAELLNSFNAYNCFLVSYTIWKLLESIWTKVFISLCKFHGSPDVMCLYVMYNFISVFNFFFLFVLTFFKCLLGS